MRAVVDGELVEFVRGSEEPTGADVGVAREHAAVARTLDRLRGVVDDQCGARRSRTDDSRRVGGGWLDARMPAILGSQSFCCCSLHRPAICSPTTRQSAYRRRRHADRLRDRSSSGSLNQCLQHDSSSESG